MTATCVLTVLGIALGLTCFLLYPQASTTSAPGSAPDQPGSVVVSLLSIERPRADDTGPTIASLRRPAFHDPPVGVDESIMGHEVIRQAVLAAVRDMGAVVRDAVVGDTVPAPEAPADLEVASLIVPGREPQLILTRRTTDGRTPLATFTLGTPGKEFIDYATLVERAESLCRPGGALAEALAQVGLKGTAVATTPEGAPGGEIEARLSQMTFTEQLAAVRLLHAEIRGRGESPERLGALARGYANLAVGTDFQWGSRHKAFQARALLVAQRLAARSPGSPSALWHRAYVRALIGLHKVAMDDLAAAAELAKGRPDVAQAPAWVPLIDALCRFQTPVLLEAGRKADGALAMLLAFMSFEESVSGVPRVVSLGQEVLDVEPECYRVHAKLGKTGGIASWHVTTRAGLAVMDRTMPGRIEHFPGVPPAIARRAADGPAEPEVVKALIESQDRGEPSLAALGRMVADTRFALVYHRAQFIAYHFNVPVGGYLDEVWPLVADHPFRAALESMRIDPQGDPGKFTELLKGVDIPDIGFNEYTFSYQVGMADIERHRRLNKLILCHGDMTYRDLTEAFKRVYANLYPKIGRDLLERSPYAPQAKMRLAQQDWAYTEPHAREWEESAGDQPDILFGLGSQYFQLKRWDDSIRCFTKLAEMSGDVSAYMTLAEVYKGKGDVENWKQTLEKARQKGDVGLGTMQVDVDLAYHYMGRKEWDKALPLARAAASSGASRGLICMAHYHEAKEEWDQAELWQRRNAERYPDGAWMAWFVFCKQTGHGDLAAARKSTQDYIASLGDQPSSLVQESIGIFRFLDGDIREARDLFRKRFQQSRFPYSGLILAALCDELGDVAERDQVLTELGDLHVQKEEQLDDLVKAIREGLGSKDGRIDKEALVAALNNTPKARMYSMAVFAARLLHAHGDPAKASEILRKTSAAANQEGWVQALANVWLREWEGRAGKAAAAPGR